MSAPAYYDGPGWVQREDGSPLNVADYLSQIRTPFSELLTVNLENVFSLTANYGLSDLRNVTTVAGSGTVTSDGTEFAIATTALASDSAELRTAQSGLYEAGYGAEIGVALRLSALPTGEQVVEWGAKRGDNAFVFGYDASGLYVRVERGGASTTVRRADFNGDTLDGGDDAENPSDFSFDVTQIHIFQIRFSYYGAGPIDFNVTLVDASGRQRVVTMHRYKDATGPSTDNPNLPIVVSVANGSTATALTAYVTGRKFAVLGIRSPNRRISGELRTAISVTTGSLIPLMSFRRKADASGENFFESVSAKVDSVQVITNNDLEIVLLVNADLTGGTAPSWRALARVDAAETCLEVDTAATAVTGGHYLTSAILIGGATGNSAALAEVEALNFDMIERQPITLAARALDATATVDALLRMREEW